MKYFEWDELKNGQLRAEREIGFEEIVVAIAEGKLLDILPHPNKNKYPNQRIYIIEINRYAYLVPFVEDEEKIFLKTIFPSRNATKKYIINK
jgi:hypothetical protein